MSLDIQLKLIIFSFLYGIFLGILMRINYKLLYNENKTIKIISTILLVISSILLYFVILLKINFGIVHYYSLLIIILGFIVETFIEVRLIPYLVDYYHKK